MPAPGPQSDVHARLLADLARARVVLCSACLLGSACRYDGAEKGQAKVMRALEGKWVVPVCPEVAGGLPTPRPAADLAGGDGHAVLDGSARVLRQDGTDVTAEFVAGARLAQDLSREHDATVALLKEGSPSCGAHRVNRVPLPERPGGPTAEGAKVPGVGVAAALLLREGLTVLSDEDLPE